MIRYFDSTVFNAGTQSIVNTVNTVGFMGKGLALEFSLRYPVMADDYKYKCKNKLLHVGRVDYFKVGSHIIVNFPTKADFKYPSRLQWIESGLKDFVATYKGIGITSVAFPKLGCSNGNLEWNDVKLIMESYLSDIDIDVCICLDSNPEPLGKEKEMVDRFNNIDLMDASRLINLNQKQIINLNAAKPIKRFFQIQYINGVGKKTYAELFKICYETTDHSSEVQLALF